MNWMQSLYETYQYCAKTNLGYVVGTKRPLLPICHITIQAHIEVVIDRDGNFLRAQLVPKNEAVTIIPATEASASRSGSKPAGHPLCDKLQYLAGDFAQYGGTVTSGFSQDPAEPYKHFVASLEDWTSKYPHPKIEAILRYVKKGSLIADLVQTGILLVDENRRLVTKNDISLEKRRGTIFELSNDQSDAVVRWIVEIPGVSESRVWHDHQLWDCWITYYRQNKFEQKGFCLITGEEQQVTTNHPKYIRREGDNAKLISSNDTEGFTFRGRFITDDQACSVSLEASQKAHYALTWLIDRQGYRDGDLAIVAWAISGASVPQPTDDPIAVLFGDLPSDDKSIDTAQEVAIRLKKKIAGYRQTIDERTDVFVLGVDSATPGRMAVIYYRALKGSDFLSRIESWHETCTWRHTYRVVEEADSTGKPRKRTLPFIGAPAPADIAEAAYGNRLDDKLKRATIKRLLPCIVDGQPLPRDLVEAVVRRASNPVGMSHNYNDWTKVLTIACALYRKYMHGKEQYDMALDESRTTRDYLYGRLLAIADYIEERALYKSEQNRPTNAIRYMQQFSQRPFRTWKQIHDLLTPYLMRLGNNAFYYKNLIAEVESMFSPEDFVSSKPLSGEYLLGFYCQRQRLLEKRSADGNSDDSVVG